MLLHERRNDIPESHLDAPKTLTHSNADYLIDNYILLGKTQCTYKIQRYVVAVPLNPISLVIAFCSDLNPYAI